MEQDEFEATILNYGEACRRGWESAGDYRFVLEDEYRKLYLENKRRGEFLERILIACELVIADPYPAQANIGLLRQIVNKLKEKK